MEKISVLGMGYIGLPTACMLANSGFEVSGVDIDREIFYNLSN
jgi:UDP-N-acetyl-D-mannosaminuronate dehydrogenase